MTDTINHQKYGKGKIISYDLENDEIHIDFEKYGLITLKYSEIRGW